MHTTYHYTFSKEFTQALEAFSKQHEKDTRNEFKEAWQIWQQENQQAIQEETQQLLEKGFQGDIQNKIYCSARYYFRKKSNKPSLQEGDRERKPKYTATSKDFLRLMDVHIKEVILHKKPSDAFADFCEKRSDDMDKERVKEETTWMERMKKTYKNRYFTATQRLAL